MNHDYLTTADILAIHADQIETYGGATGLRDAGQLEAALFRPQSGYYADHVAEAAALWESLSQNHPFVDGNERTAFAGMLTFLNINGMDLTAGGEETQAFVMELYENGRFEFEALELWLRNDTQLILSDQAPNL